MASPCRGDANAGWVELARGRALDGRLLAGWLERVEADVVEPDGALAWNPAGVEYAFGVVAQVPRVEDPSWSTSEGASGLRFDALTREAPKG